MTQAYDAIVVGVGGMGSAALYHLATAGKRVLGIERFELGHARGSSHGETRIIRKAYFEGPNYVPLVVRSYDLWQGLGAAANTQLLFRTGSLEMAEPGFDFVDRSRASCLAHDLPHEMLTAADVMQRFPAYRLAAGTRAIYQPDGGYVLSEVGIAAHARLAVGRCAVLHTGETVLGFRPTADGGVTVSTDRATYSAGHLVLTAGAWMRQLVPSLATPLATFKQTVAWFAPRQPDLFSAARFPVFIHFGPQGEFYGFPMHGTSGLKIGGPHFGREPIDPDAADREPAARQLAALQTFAQDYLPQSGGIPQRGSGCIYTKTPDEDFIIDRLPGNPQVVVVSACSGHGYKFTPVIGEIVKQLVVDGHSSHDLSAFSIDRFRSPSV